MSERLSAARQRQLQIRVQYTKLHMYTTGCLILIRKFFCICKRYINAVCAGKVYGQGDII